MMFGRRIEACPYPSYESSYLDELRSLWLAGHAIESARIEGRTHE